MPPESVPVVILSAFRVESDCSAESAKPPCVDVAASVIPYPANVVGLPCSSAKVKPEPESIQLEPSYTRITPVVEL